jgi:hypothetical protein
MHTETVLIFLGALKIVDEKFSDILRSSFFNIEETIKSIDWSKAPGFIETKSGFRKKYDLLMNGYISEFFCFPEVINEIPIWKASGKEDEWLTVEEYMEEFKQRTFIIEPICLLFHHKRIYGRQVENFKNFWWSAYGFNPYEGGVHDMAQRLLKFKRKFKFDGKKWDRMFPHLQEVFNLKNKYLPDDPFKAWVTEHNVNSHVVFPNGDFVYKTWGNNSGSGSTTMDNILGMAICLVHSYLRLTHGDMSIFDNNEKVFAFLFGDDVVGGDNLDYTDQEVERVVRETFGLYGIELDPYQASENLEDMDFLGFTFAQVRGYWIPVYNKSKLMHSFLYNLKRMENDGEVSKILSLLIMSLGHGEDFYTELSNIVKTILVNVDTELSLLLRENNWSMFPTYDGLFHWYVGLEGQHSTVLSFLLERQFIFGVG